MSFGPDILRDWQTLKREHPRLQGSFDERLARRALMRQAASSVEADLDALGQGGKVDEGRLRQLLEELRAIHFQAGLIELRLCEMVDERAAQ